MWFVNKKQPNSEETYVPEELAHWPTERMIQEGHSDYALPSDLEELDNSLLADIAQICEVDQYAPDECIPCLADVMLGERQKQESPPDPTDPTDLRVPSFERVSDVGDDEQEFVGLAEAMEEEPLPVMAPAYEEPPIADQFAAKVRELDALVAQLLEGPPIPPPDVTMEELSLLVVAAQRWIKITDAQGVELSGVQEQVLDATRALVSRLHHG